MVPNRDVPSPTPAQPTDPSGPGRPTDVVLFGGTVLTMDGANTRHEAVLVRDGRIAAVGTSREMLGAAGETAESVDIEGRVVLPGFIETHTHPLMVGQRVNNPIDPTSPANGSIDDIRQRVEAAARGRSGDDWLIGWGYDDTAIRDMRHPTRHDLDEVAPNCPVVLHHISGHVAVVNTAALQRMGITPGTADPDGGFFGRDENGTPNGVLFETATYLVYPHLPKPGVEEEAETLAIVGRELLRLGITTVHDLAMGAHGPEAYQLAMARHGFVNRVRGYLTRSALATVESRPNLLTSADAGDFRVLGAKLWADGSIQAETGYLARPYHCSPTHHGAPTMTPDELFGTTRDLDERGWQLAIHANGDAAIDLVLDAYEALGSGSSALPHRIEHFQTAREDQIDRTARLGALPSVFAKHVKYWGDRHRGTFLGAERAARISPLASIRSRGIPFALHSDAPVSPLSALEGVQIAVTRRTSGGEILGEQQAVPVEAALAGYTSNAARFSGDEESFGVIRVGLAADLVVLEADPTRVDPEQIAEIGVRATYLGGRLVHTAE